MQFQFTHPGRGATVVRDTPHILQHVSIHAPREGCDTFPRASRRGWRSFNSRTPGGVRLPCLVRELNPGEFQFTHPGRGATKRATTQVVKVRFQFTHPGRGATVSYPYGIAVQIVSIHAPREGCDCRRSGVRHRWSCFNSRTPGGVRPNDIRHCLSILGFQFTHPGRGATSYCPNGHLLFSVSIHAPREGCDSVVQSCVLWGG